ncbi:hypothetical protein GCM10027073_60740 [Streptomyces chlorus]|uniref:ISKra4 family transposase n=1 Tax=Streptomyces chlorus TaxID=887452 RepID=A0ABW1E7X4_9ACTN
MEPYDAIDEIDVFTPAVRAFEALKTDLAGPTTAHLAHHELEEMLTEQGRELQRLLFQAHLDLRARREEQASPAVVHGHDHQPRPHREKGHRRLLACVFGTVTVKRCVWRGKGLSGVRPADAALSLPAGRHSHQLARLAVLEAVRGSYDQAKTAIEQRCGKVLGKRQAEQLVVAAARDIDAFYQQKIPLPASADTLLVMQVDGKGVVMRPDGLREATRRKAEAATRTLRCRLAPGEKANRKRMATLACVFDADPAPRRPHDIIAPPDGRSGQRERRKGPQARAKWLTASVVQDADRVVSDAFDQAEDRDPHHRRCWVALVDGARHQLDLLHTEADRRGIELHVLLDFVHVSEYCWAAAHALHQPGTPEAEAWVGAQLTTILHGQAARAAAEMTHQADRAGLTGSKREAIDKCVHYLTGHLDQLHYDTALAAGWPIATGAIEGAARHIVGDRLEITGSRWGLPGAEAILGLRALIDNGDFDTYWTYHLHTEHDRLYPTPETGPDQHNYGLTT